MVIMELDKTGKRVLLQSPYNKQLVEAIRNIPGRQWRKEIKRWEIPMGEITSAIRVLKGAGWEYKVTPELKRVIVADREKKEELLALKFEDTVHFNPPGFRSELRPFQKVGALFLVKAGRAVLADDMGLGKSIQALAAVVALQVNRTLVLAPATLVDNWEKEILKHVPGIHYIKITDEKREVRQALWETPVEEPTLWITNYEKLLHDWDMMPHRWDAIVADEVSSRIKNYRTQQTKNLKRLDAEYRFGLTGTPIENALVEFHSVMDWIEPGLLGPGHLFVKRYGIINEYTGKVEGYQHIEEVQIRVSPYLLRRTKEEVLPELPSKIIQDYDVVLTKAEREEYRAASNNFEEWWAETTGENAWGEAVVKIIRLKQLVDHPKLVGIDLNSSKLEELKDILVELRGHKVVVFTQFKTMAYLMAEELDRPEYQYKVWMVTGDQKKNRLKLIDDFQEHDGSAVLIMTEIGSRGLTITEADYIIHYDYPWNPAVLRQREDRLHRMGQKNVVNVINLIAAETIDEYIWEVLYDKEKLAKEFLEGTESEVIFKRLGRSDLLRLVRGDKRKRRSAAA